jgi:tetratricopeptide (TPR) repeat protein
MKRTLWGFGLFWFFVTMLPGLGFIWLRGGILAERFTYAAVMGFAFVLVWGLQRLLVRSQASTDANGLALKPVLARYAPLLGLMVVVTGLYSFKTVERNRDWKNNFVLFNSALPYAQNSCQVQRHVANEWIEKGLKDRAKADSVAAAFNAIKPKASPEQLKKAQVLIDTSVARANKHGRWALNHLQESTRIYPNFGEAYFSMAYVFQKITPNVDSAKYYYKQTIRAASAYAPAYNNLGVIYQGEGFAQNNRQKLELASYYYNQSMIVNPAYVDGQNNRASLLKATGLDVRSLPDSIIRNN